MAPLSVTLKPAYTVPRSRARRASTGYIACSWQNAVSQSRLPDLRNLLYWNPAIRTTATGAAPLEFYTGDQAGRYLVVVQGLATNGLAGSHGFALEVKPAL